METEAELKRMIRVFLNMEKDVVVKYFKVEDETINLKLFDKICENLKKINTCENLLRKFDGFDINSIFGCFGMFGMKSKDPHHLKCYLEAFENISANIAGVKSDAKNNGIWKEMD